MAIRLFLLSSRLGEGLDVLDTEREERRKPSARAESGSLREMTIEDVQGWLANSRLDKSFAHVFRELQINGEMLLDLTMDDLVEMNAGLNIQRRRLLRLIADATESETSCREETIANLLDNATIWMDYAYDLRRSIMTKQIWEHRALIESACSGKKDESAMCVSDAMQWFHRQDVCSVVSLNRRRAAYVYDALRTNVLAPYADIFQPSRLFTLDRFDRAYHVVRALSWSDNDDEQRRALPTTSARGQIRSSNHTTSYLLATVGDYATSIEPAEVVRFKRDPGRRRRGGMRAPSSDAFDRVVVSFPHNVASTEAHMYMSHLALDLVKGGRHRASVELLGMNDDALRFDVNETGIVPDDTLIALRFHMLNDADLEELRADDVVRRDQLATRAMSGQPWTSRNEREVFRHIIDLSRTQLESFATSLAVDHVMLRELERRCETNVVERNSEMNDCGQSCLLVSIVRSRVRVKRVFQAILSRYENKLGA